ncbi:MAG: LytTR family DNA-binding domain-containing protein [Spirosomataceae bacterium]
MNSSCFRMASFGAGQYADFKEIVCLVADGNYSCIYLNNGRQIMVSKCLECLEQYLPQHAFLRIHKSYLINPDYVDCILIGQKQVRLTNGNVYAISRRKWRQTYLYFKQRSQIKTD